MIWLAVSIGVWFLATSTTFPPASVTVYNPPTLADQLSAAGHHDEAITEYYRLLYLDDGRLSAEQCYLRVAGCYDLLGNTSKAIQAAESAIAAAETDSSRVERRIDHAEFLARYNQTAAAALELVRLRSFYDLGARAERAAILLVTCQVRDAQWTLARETVRSLHSAGEPSRVARVDSLLQIAAATRGRSPAKARLLSTFLPGAGQAYAGSPLEGLQSLALNAFFVGWGIHAVTTSNLADGVLAAEGLRRFYQGGRRNAYQRALEYNDDRLDDVRAEILDLLQH